MFLSLILFFSIGTIQASDVNAYDNMTESGGDVDCLLDDGTQLEEGNVETEIENINSSLQENVKNQTELTSPTTSMYYNGNYRVTLMDSDSNTTLPNKQVNFVINGIRYSATTNANGVASVNLKLNPGKYPVTAFFEGDDEFNVSNNLSGQVEILRTIKASDVTKYYKGSKCYSATFLDTQGKPLKNKKVTITVNGKKYTKNTDSKGVASFSIDFKPNTYKVVATNPSNGYTLTTNFKILRTVTSSDLKKVRGDSKKYVVKFYKNNGKPLSNQKVKITINGKVYKHKTNANGEVKLAFNDFKAGTYKVVSYNTDGLSKTNTVYLYSKASTKISVGRYTFLENEVKEIKIKFTTNLDDNSKSGKRIEIDIDGDAHYARTDSNGEIKFKLPSLYAEVHEIECYYGGDKFFRSSYARNYVTILDTSNTEFYLESEDLSFGNFAGTPLEVSLTAGDVPLIRKTVCFTVNDKDYNVTTNDWGVASFPVKLDVGNYTVNYKSFADSRVKAASGSCEIKVFKRTDTKIDYKFQSSYKDYSQTIKVQLVDSNGKPVKYAEVEFKIGDETYFEETNSKGYAYIYISPSLGKYKCSIKFKGNNEYASCSASGTMNVVLSKYANGINEKNAKASSDYLKATRNCQVNNGKIKSLVNSLTKGLTNNVDKARAIFYYVRDNVDYDFYYGTKQGAVGTLNSKKANCVDQSHLLVAMFRTAGLKARYVYGICTYSDGTYGHYWTQVLLDNTWVCADSVGRGNELGQINDWNTKTFKFRAKYLSAP